MQKKHAWLMITHILYLKLSNYGLLNKILLYQY